MRRHGKAFKDGMNEIFISVQRKLTQIRRFDGLWITVSCAIFLLDITATEQPHRKSLRQHNGPVLTSVLQGFQ